MIPDSHQFFNSYSPAQIYGAATPQYVSAAVSSVLERVSASVTDIHGDVVAWKSPKQPGHHVKFYVWRGDVLYRYFVDVNDTSILRTVEEVAYGL